MEPKFKPETGVGETGWPTTRNATILFGHLNPEIQLALQEGHAYKDKSRRLEILVEWISLSANATDTSSETLFAIGHAAKKALEYEMKLESAQDGKEGKA